MNTIVRSIVAGLFATSLCTAIAQPTMETNAVYHEPHRPQIHFSPKAHWMNDPNGMVYYKGMYHLFFQYYPDSTVWGPMHWGHAMSKDLVHWEEGPIAIYPDSIGLIFSGSAVVDSSNTTDFGKEGKAPLIAIYAQHDMDAESGGKSDTFQTQSIAYSLDEGMTWTKYAGNPVLRNPGIRDFRDPKVMWYAPQKKWIMTLATKDRITFYSSKNMKEWKKESEFGATVGAHGGVWECPDLFPLTYGGKTIWILLVSINPGGPNSGSATQYFTGNFDGKTFAPLQTDIRWVDWGTDDYAGVTWSNTGKRKIFLGWMSNWLYAQQVPTNPWRSAMTVPRDLRLEKIGAKYYLASQPVPELQKLAAPTTASNAATAYSSFTTTGVGSVSFSLSNDKGEYVEAGYDAKTNRYFIDRSHSGDTSFTKGFGAIQYAPRISTAKTLEFQFVVDAASIEMFADNGLTTMTSIFFPTEPFKPAFKWKMNGGAKKVTVIKKKETALQSIWK